MKQDTKIIAFRCPECGSTIIGKFSVFDLASANTSIECEECHESKIVITKTGDGGLRFSVPCFACPSPHFYTVSSAVIFTSPLFTLQCPYTGFDIMFIGERERVFKALDESDELLRTLLDPETFEDDDDDTEGGKGSLKDVFGDDEFITASSDEALEEGLKNSRDIFAAFSKENAGKYSRPDEDEEDPDGADDYGDDINSALKAFSGYRKSMKSKPVESKELTSPATVNECTDPVVMSEIIYLLHDLAEEGRIRCSCGSGKIALGLGYDSVVLTCTECGRTKKIPALSEGDIMALEDLSELTI